jgi:shikimate 5-dehydrogenase
VLCLGAGGAGTALALTLAGRAAGDRPARIILVDTLAARLAHARAVLERQGAATPVAYVESESVARNDALLAGLPAGSLVINATGMGKDRPGSPITDAARFPAQGVVWELNYRGELGFLRQAQAQATARALTIHDGWDYFVRGWATVLGHVLKLDINEPVIKELGELAVGVR